MQGTTRHRSYQLAWFPLHGLVVLSVVGPALVGQMPVDAARTITARRLAAGRHTEVVSLAGAGHRTILPGEPEVSGGMRMARGGTPDADRALGAMAWPAVHRLLTGAAGPTTG